MGQRVQAVGVDRDALQGAGVKPLLQGEVLVADGQIARTAATSRAPIDVAVGVLIAGRDARFLMTSRPQGKVYAGYWEFPGGKVEPEETVEQALRRELREELGVEATSIEAWKEQCVDYPHALVRLHFMKVTAWEGELQMREAQACSWESLPVGVSPVLPGALPVLKWLADERAHDA